MEQAKTNSPLPAKNQKPGTQRSRAFFISADALTARRIAVYRSAFVVRRENRSYSSHLTAKQRHSSNITELVLPSLTSTSGMARPADGSSLDGIRTAGLHA
jgi:hypothetical protein